jgi:hypothetical protein
MPRTDFCAHLLKKTRRRHGTPICDDDAIVVSLGSN